MHMVSVTEESENEDDAVLLSCVLLLPLLCDDDWLLLLPNVVVQIKCHPLNLLREVKENGDQNQVAIKMREVELEGLESQALVF